MARPKSKAKQVTHQVRLNLPATLDVQALVRQAESEGASRASLVFKAIDHYLAELQGRPSRGPASKDHVLFFTARLPDDIYKRVVKAARMHGIPTPTTLVREAVRHLAESETGKGPAS